MIQFKRLLHMYSFYNMIAAYVAAFYMHRNINCKYCSIVIDTIRASCLYVALVVLYYYIIFGFRSPQRFYRKILGVPTLSLFASYMIDVIVHFLPVLLLGFPKSFKSYILAIVPVLLWYLLVRHKAHLIYGNELGKKHMDTIIFVYAPIICIIILLVFKLFRS